MNASWRSLWNIMQGQRLRFGAAIGALVIGTLLAYLVPLIIQAMLDGVIGGQGAASERVAAVLQWLGGEQILRGNIWIAVLAIVGVTLFSGVFLYLKGRWAATASEKIAVQLRNRLYVQLQRVPCRFHDKSPTGDLVQRCTADVETIRLFLSAQVVEIGNAIILLLTVLPIMYWLSPYMMLVSVCMVPFIVAYSVAFFVKARRLYKASDEAEGRMSAALQENLTGIRVVRAFARQDFEAEKFAARNSEYRDRIYKLMRLLAIYWSSSDLMCLSQMGLVLIVGARAVGNGEISVGTLYAFITYVNMFMWPVRQMGRTLTDTGKMQVALGRVQEILNEAPEDAADQIAAQLPVASGRIAFEKVSFKHGQRPVLHDVSFEVQPGQTVALLGPSGAGKSTLMQLLLRLYAQDSGRILLDGLDHRGIDRRELRRQMGVVLQEPFLFSKNVRENIGLSRPDASAPEIEQAAIAANVHDNIVRFEQGYETLVGERGVTLSGGQRQRVALARAILRDAPILILDDALSAVDTQTEHHILKALRARAGKRTTIIIAHRLSTLMHADRIFVLEQGRITQSGTHAELVRGAGLYQRLWQIQTALEEDLKHEIERQPVIINQLTAAAVEAKSEARISKFETNPNF